MSHDIDDPRYPVKKSDAAMAHRTRPDAIPGGAPRRDRARLQRQVLGPLGRRQLPLHRLRQELFKSDEKFDAGCGWPSWWKEVEPGRIERVVDHSHGMMRVEVRCAKCGSHLGHVFDDGPEPTGERYCINSASIDFTPKPDPPRLPEAATLTAPP